MWNHVSWASTWTRVCGKFGGNRSNESGRSGASYTWQKTPLRPIFSEIDPIGGSPITTDSHLWKTSVLLLQLLLLSLFGFHLTSQLSVITRYQESSTVRSYETHGIVWDAFLDIQPTYTYTACITAHFQLTISWSYINKIYYKSLVLVKGENVDGTSYYMQYMYSMQLIKTNAGTFVPKNFRSRERKFHRTFIPWNFRTLELSLPGTKVLWNFRTLELSLPGTFVPFHKLSLSELIF